MINRKWKNSSKNCRAYESFESIASDHRIVSAHLKLSLRSNKKKTVKTPIYDWTTLKNPDIQKKFICEVLKKFENLNDETSNISTNTLYDHFETSCRETAIDIIPFKEKLKKRSPWENPDICLKRDMLKTAAQ